MSDDSTALFDAERWFITLSEELDAYRALENLIHDQAALQVHLTPIVEEAERWASPLRSRNQQGLPLEPAEGGVDEDYPGFSTRYVQSLLDTLLQAFATYQQQTLVVAVTYLEVITEDFLRVFFTHFPDKMYEYLNQRDQNQGKISLKEVLEAESKEALLLSLATRSAQLAGQGKFRTVVDGISRMTHCTIDKELVQRLQILIDSRNTIVHESRLINIRGDEIENSLVDVMKLSEELGLIAKRANIPTRTIPSSDDFAPDDELLQRWDAEHRDSDD